MVARKSLEPLQACPHLSGAFELLGRRWSGIVLDTLATRPARFGELRMAVHGISDKVLSARLRELVDAGLVTHTHLPPGPAVYTLTADGHALAPAFEQLRTWWKQHTTTTHT
ncbi:winged helix-turn-helix transcriptional regulator [Streptomyces sp. NPDC001177]